ncbi:hypothetical protein DM806_01405 [Sphingobium lactosutens]|uniref:hypothetical protein n=1 Tax=Sphingobium lactosutens TaxID=522773 RepID=UPI0015BD65D1|nr:hypothetical protein [Sphingobium lactosutens]NWK94362.1 hypothetical protein [Sphingobium lactosutens]
MTRLELVSSQDFIDTLIQFNPPRAEAGSVYTHPIDDEAYSPRISASRRMSLLPIAPDLPDHLYAMLRYSKKYPLEPVIEQGGSGCFLISDTIKGVLDELQSPRIEYIPVTAYRCKRVDRDGFPHGFGEEIDEPYWLMNCINNYDVIDRERTVGSWFYPDERQLSRDKEGYYFSPDDPPRLVGPKRLVLKEYPRDAMFGLVGLPDVRFVSEEFFDRLMASGLFTRGTGRFGTWGPFRRFYMNASQRGLGGYGYGGRPLDEIVPFRLNGRTLYWGDFTHDPLSFGPPHGE